MPEIGTNAEALEIAKAEYEKGKQAPLQVEAEILRFTDNTSANNMFGDKTIMLDNARFGYIADPSTTTLYIRDTQGNTDLYQNYAWAWASPATGNLFQGMVSALNTPLNGYQGGSTPVNVDFDEQGSYNFYGARSVSYAVQVVHIPRNMPKKTEKVPGVGYNLDGRLRVAIEVGDGTAQEYESGVNNPCFTIKLLDLVFNGGASREAISGGSTSSVVVDANGFYEIDIPATYWT